MLTNFHRRPSRLIATLLFLVSTLVGPGFVLACKQVPGDEPTSRSDAEVPGEPNETPTHSPVESSDTEPSESEPSEPKDQDHPPVRQPLPSSEEIAQLPPDGGPDFNRLVFEASPYLRQHARNPVDWWPWGDAAFAEAAKLDRPVFLSIGYATCHWCHVMEHESFEDAEIAQLMNDTFICVKVDREERPDLDHVYMQVTQALNQRGGWPMTVVMTPDAEPFFAGTYFPKEDRGGRSGMRSLVPSLGKAWAGDRAKILESATGITEWLRKSSVGAAGEDLTERDVANAIAQLGGRFDPRFKGFGEAPKFPIPHNLTLLLRWAQRKDDAQLLRMVEQTLVAMRGGGIFDQIGGGFHRYSTDERWFLPHFEKMLYDQALHVMAYTGAAQITGDPQHRATVDEIITYVLRDLGDPGGGFYCAEDADSEGEEGVFYTWPLAELTEVLGAADAALVAALYDVTAEGNYVDEGSRTRMARSILMPVGAPAKIAAQLGLDVSDVAPRIEAAHAKLFAHREHRIRPFLDDKVLTDWNGLMIVALARAGFAFNDSRALLAAQRSAEFVLRELRTDDGRLIKRWRAGEAGMPATLEDYAFLAWGLLELYQADFDVRWLREAKATIDTMIAHFHDAEHGGFFMTADDGAKLLVRAKEAYDGAIPSGNSAAAYALVQLARLTGEPKYEELAASTFRAFAGRISQGPSAFAQMMQAVEMVAGGGVEIVIAGSPDDPRTQALLDVVRGTYLSSGVLAVNDPAQAETITQWIPYAGNMPALDGVPTAYVCRGYVCDAPVTDAESLRIALEAAVRVETK